MHKRHFSPTMLVEVAHRQAKGEHFGQHDNRGRWQLSTGVDLNYNVVCSRLWSQQIITNKLLVSETLQLHNHISDSPQHSRHKPFLTQALSL